MSQTFQKRVEDFTCENCGYFIQGHGYTNHCPQCLWSKHVDKYPGDRKETCHGLMEPIGLLIKNKRTVIIHRCVKCRTVKNNSSCADDNPDALANLAI